MATFKELRAGFCELFVNVCKHLYVDKRELIVSYASFGARLVPQVALELLLNYSCSVSDERRNSDSRGDEVARIGLCSDCLFMRQIESDRGSIFFLCELSATDPKYPKYPRLPVRQCLGYKARPRA